MSGDLMPYPLKVLMIGEGGLGAQGGTPGNGLRAELERGGYEPTFECVKNREQLISALAGRADIAISDFATGEFGALEALRVIQEQAIDLPLIVVSGKIKDSDVLSVLKAGAADHVTRGNLMRLTAAVEREIRGARMRRERIRLE